MGEAKQVIGFGGKLDAVMPESGPAGSLPAGRKLLPMVEGLVLVALSQGDLDGCAPGSLGACNGHLGRCGTI
jgi:hypothetical protein